MRKLKRCIKRQFKRHLLPFVVSCVLIMTGLAYISYQFGVNTTPAKEVVVKAVSAQFDRQEKVINGVLPNGDLELTINGKSVTVPGETFEATRNLVTYNHKAHLSLLKVAGEQITEDRIATLAYYAKTYNVNPKVLLEWLTEE